MKHPHVRGEDKAYKKIIDGLVETPPRAWGRHTGSLGGNSAAGNTPTCVGKTSTCEPHQQAYQKHPHVRGEDTRTPHAMQANSETPPRAWGRRSTVGRTTCRTRNTPTCVGKTPCRHSTTMRGQKHPHVRGEDPRECGYILLHEETPPRAWGRPTHVPPNKRLWRNTPTCVGKTPSRLTRLAGTWKHPHVRGEDHAPKRVQYSYPETPPRAWGRQRARWMVIRSGRNTPTCVGKTAVCQTSRYLPRKHPHVRGEDQCWQVDARAIGNTPTCVGKTGTYSVRSTSPRKHPHVRGEDGGEEGQVWRPSETPPRAWGRLPAALPAAV